MTASPAPVTIVIDDRAPVVDETAWVAPGAVLAGAVSVGPETGIWYACVLRADLDTITIGARTNIQDGCVLHSDPGVPLTVGDGVSVGHRAVLHGATIENDVLIGMGAVVLNGARIGAGSLIAAGAVVLEGTDVPPGSLVAGLPGKVRRELTDEERTNVRANAEVYRELARRHAEAV